MRSAQRTRMNCNEIIPALLWIMERVSQPDAPLTAHSFNSCFLIKSDG